MADEKTLTLSQAANRLGWRWRTMWEAVISGELPGKQKPNGRWMVSEAAIEEILRGRPQ